MENSTEDPFDSVKQSVSTGDGEVAGTFYEKRKYPLLPEGEYTAICCKSEVKDGNPNSKYYKEGEKKIHLRWQIQNDRNTGAPVSYPDSQDETKTRNYIVFNKSLSISFGDRSGLQKLWKQLTGYDAEPFAIKTPKKIPLGNGKFREGTYIVFPHSLFENMMCSLSISHNEWNGELRPQIDSYSVSPQQKSHNQSLLPGGHGTMPPIGVGVSTSQPSQVNTSVKLEKQSDLPFDVKPTAEPGSKNIHQEFVNDSQKTINEARERGFPID